MVFRVLTTDGRRTVGLGLIKVLSVLLASFEEVVRKKGIGGEKETRLVVISK